MSIKLVNEDGHTKKVAEKDLAEWLGKGYEKYVVEGERVKEEPEPKEFDADDIITVVNDNRTTIKDLEELVESYGLDINLDNYSLKAEKINAIIDVVENKDKS
jgi:hypothetical protein